MEVFDFSGKTISIDTTFLLKSNTIYRNGSIKIDGILPNMLQAYGSLGGSATAEVVGGKATLTKSVGIPSVITNLYFRSSQIFSPLDGGKLAHWANLVKREDDVLFLDRIIPEGEYTVYFPVQPTNIILENLTILGPCKYGLRIYLGNQIYLNNVKTFDTTYAGVSLESTINSSVDSLVGRKTDHLTGAAYGLAIVGACNGVTVSYSKFSDVRHGVTVGGTEGTSDNIIITKNIVEASSDAGIDVHPNARSVIIGDNIVTINSVASGQTGDGITVQNSTSIISNNIIRGATREAILVQPLVNSKSEHIVSDNIIKDCQYGILVDKHYKDSLYLEVSGNIMRDVLGRNCQIQGNSQGYKALVAGRVEGRHNLIVDKRNIATDITHKVDSVLVYD